MNLVNYDKNTLIMMFEDYARTYGNTSIEDYLDKSGIVTDFTTINPGEILTDTDGRLYVVSSVEFIFDLVAVYGNDPDTGEDRFLPLPLFRKKKKPELTLCVTGHRPSALGWGYDYSSEKWTQLKEKLKKTLMNLLLEYESLVCWSGMALGVDTVFAQVILEMRNTGFPVKLCCAIPCRAQPDRWPKAARDLYNGILVQTDVVKYVQENYTPSCLQKRNEFMVDRSAYVIAVWNGSSGGTANCVSYAEKKDIKIHLIRPGLEDSQKEKAE